jgi:hypothetical protein
VKTIIASAFFLAFLVSCDSQPQRTRAGGTFLTSENFTAPTGGLSNTSGNLGSNTGTTNSGTTTTPSNTGYENCDTNSKYTVTIGHFTLCQKSTDETIVKLQTENANTTQQVCVIPTFRDSTGASIYIGNPQCAFTQAGVAIEGRLYKDRAGHTSHPINGAIVMQKGLLPEYYACMDAMSPKYGYTSAACPNGALQNAICYQAATDYMLKTCQNFKSKYSNVYLDIKFK